MDWEEACTSSHNWSVPLAGVIYSFNFCITSAPTCAIGFWSCDRRGQVSTSKLCINNHCWSNFVLGLCWNMTWEGSKRYHSIVFMTSSWKIQSLCHLPPLTCTCIPCHMKSYNYTQKIVPPSCLIIWITWWVCNWGSPSLTQHQVRPSYWNLLILVSSLKITLYHSWSLQSQQCWANSKTHSWLWATTSSASLRLPKTLHHDLHTSLCWCSTPHSSAHSKYSSCLQHYLVNQL